MGASASAVMTNSSRSLVATTLVYVAPSSSSRARAFAASSARSPESIRTAPRARARRPGPRSGCPRRCRRCRRARWCRPLGLDLAAERRLLALVREDERVRRGADGRDAVAPAGGQVAGRREPGEVGGSGGGDRGLLVGTASAHLDDRPARRGGDHPRRGRRDRGVVVEHAQDQRLQDDALTERPPRGQHGAAREVEVALGVGVDVAAEPEVTQVRRSLLADHPLLHSQRPRQGRT